MGTEMSRRNPTRNWSKVKAVRLMGIYRQEHSHFLSPQYQLSHSSSDAHSFSFRPHRDKDGWRWASHSITILQVLWLCLIKGSEKSATFAVILSFFIYFYLQSTANSRGRTYLGVGLDWNKSIRKCTSVQHLSQDTPVDYWVHCGTTNEGKDWVFSVGELKIGTSLGNLRALNSL